MTAEAKETGVTFSCDGKPLTALPGETILQALQRVGHRDIPHLCYKDGYRPDGNCRACMVEIKGERALAPSCWRQPTPDMEVVTDNERCLQSQRLVLELLLSDMPDQGASPHRRDSELDQWADKLQVSQPRFPHRPSVPAADNSHPAMSVNLDTCIQCTRCVRACREEQVNDVIGYAFRGGESKIVFDMDDPMGASTCVGCGECVQACPTGALMPAGEVGLAEIDRQVDSVCPYCGVGCLLRFHIQKDRIQYVNGRQGPSNKGRLCVKGRFGFDYVHHSDRLRVPLLRRPGVEKTADIIPPEQMDQFFQPATWEEALSRVVEGFAGIRDKRGGKALAGFGSAKGSNEEAYLFQKLVRTGFGSNNVDHCTRLCHASSVAALLEGIGSGAVSNPVEDVSETDVIIIIGARPTVNHPVAATFMKNAVRNGKTLILIDPYTSDLARHAHYHLAFEYDTDVPLLNALMHVIIEENLHDKEFIRERTAGFDELQRAVKDYSPEKVAPVCKVPADMLRKVARVYAEAKSAMIFWGMGISQHVHGTDNARCLIALALLTGHIGRPGTGLHPLRGQNNVQGASDVGLIPMVYPDYQPVDDPEIRATFEKIWQTSLDPEPGLTVVEIMKAITDGDIEGMYIMGENPAMSDPDLSHARASLAALKHLVVQDIFFTETAGFADVILPASAFPEKTGTFTNTDRRVQMGRQALPPPGEARQDLWIINEIGRRLGLDWNYNKPSLVFEEMRQVMPSIAGMTWENLEQADSLTYPLTAPDLPGMAVLFSDGFMTDDARGRFVPADYKHAAELPDKDYPWVFTTGRYLEHWHTGSMTRRAEVLSNLEPNPIVNVHPEDMEKLGAENGDWLRVESRRGSVEALARPDPGLMPGKAFMAFCFREAAANLLTNPKLDQFGKIPEFKYCAVRLTKTRPHP